MLSISASRSAGTRCHFATAVREMPRPRAMTAMSPRRRLMMSMPSAMVKTLTVGLQPVHHHPGQLVNHRLTGEPLGRKCPIAGDDKNRGWIVLAMKIGSRIAAARGLVELSQADLAREIDVSRQLVSQWEHHEKNRGVKCSRK
jgi:DNA-binding XRE family transcriptional regulator